MTHTIGNQARPLWVAVVGAGPAGFYAIESLLKSDAQVRVDIFERLPTPFGLVRSGVAPDHQSIKGVTRIYDKILADERVRFFGHVTVGHDITPDELLAHYDQVIYAVGAQSDRKMGIPGEALVGSAPATAFVGWYNAHPDYRDAQFDLQCARVVVIGNGNVAMDVTRALMAPVDELATTDMADHAVAALRASRVQQVVMLGRRGPVQAAFTTPELKEFGELHGVDVLLDEADFVLDATSETQLATEKVAARNMDVMRDYMARAPHGSGRSIHMQFLWSPVEIIGAQGRVTGIVVERNRLAPDGNGGVKAVGTGVTRTIECGLVLRSVGYRSVPIVGVPFDDKRGLFPNRDGRMLVSAGGDVLARCYVVGWAKRGPSGVIGTNKPDSVATVTAMKEDWPTLQVPTHRDGNTIVQLLAARHVTVIDYAKWQKIDAHESAAGAAHGRPRVKLTRVTDMLDVAQ
jgi:ferredoxin--NADP+ reductase